MKKIIMGLTALIMGIGLVSGLAYYINEDRASEGVYAEGEESGIFVPILMYHNITDKAYGNKYTVTKAELESDLKYIDEKGYTTVGINDLIAYVEGNGELPEKPIVLTFDDGYESLYVIGAPLFENYNAKVVVGVIGELTEMFTKEEDHNIEYSHLNMEEINEMSKTGIFEFQNHTYYLHKIENGRKGAAKKKGESEEQYSELLKKDLEKVNEQILECTGRKPTAFIYPYGSFSDCSDGIVKELGFNAIVNCTEKPNYIDGPEDLYTLYRYLRPSGVGTAEVFGKFEKLDSHASQTAAGGL